MENQGEYNAASIKILSADEAAERFDFAAVGRLSERYPGSAPAFIARMVEACQLSGWPVDQAERRYLAGDKSIEPTPEFREVHRELADQRWK